jgi:hypothetical protein
MIAFITAFFLSQVKPDQDIVKLEKALSEKPDDVTTNLALGKYYLAKDNPEKAIPFLLKGSDVALKAAAKAEGVNEGNAGLIALEAGDLWTQTMPKSGPLRQPCFDRANFWYAKAWPDLDVLYKTNLRNRLVKFYMSTVSGRGGKAPVGWTTGETSLTSTRVRSGGSALKVTPRKGTKQLVSILQVKAPLPKGKTLEFSGWSCSEDTDGNSDKIKLEITGAGGESLFVKEYHFGIDSPIWTKFAEMMDSPPGATNASLELLINSSKGAIYLDDISIKLDGKELLPKGSFEP